jgi:hypothetical protein
MKIKRSTLKKAKPENLLRLAKYLKLRTDGMSHRNVSKLIYWLLTRREKRERGLTWAPY